MKLYSCIKYVSPPFIAESGRSDVERTITDFLFTPSSNSSFASFIIVDDDVLEFDELFIARFDFAPEISSSWNARKGVISTTYIVIRDDDCEFWHEAQQWLIDYSMLPFLTDMYLQLLR